MYKRCLQHDVKYTTNELKIELTKKIFTSLYAIC